MILNLDTERLRTLVRFRDPELDKPAKGLNSERRRQCVKETAEVTREGLAHTGTSRT